MVFRVDERESGFVRLLLIVALLAVLATYAILTMLIVLVVLVMLIALPIQLLCCRYLLIFLLQQLRK